MKKIYILVQEYDNWFGKLYKKTKGGKYNHASIGLTNTMKEFYSFRSKWGFCIEHPFQFDKEHKKTVPCAVYEIQVTQEQYSQIKQEINYFLENKETYRYSYLSIFLGFFGIRHRFSKGYYCSRFVAHILESSEVTILSKHSSVCLPSDLYSDYTHLYFEGLAKEYSKNLCFV